MDQPLTKNIARGDGPPDLAAYKKNGGYRALEKALGMFPSEVIEEVKRSNLRGRGGAGFPTGMKWSFVPPRDKVRGHKYLVANADEMEPGTFKDRVLMEGDPHQLLEGMIISAYAMEASVAYIFLRWEYRESDQRLRRAMGEAYGAGLLGRRILGTNYDLELHIHVSAGRYMCGEETGLLNALEGRRATPRAKPPYPQLSGLWGQPTVVQNVETLCNVPHIIEHGAEWFNGLSKLEKDGGTKLFGVSGKVRRPGLWELPMGTTAREVLYEYAGGMQDGLELKGFLPGGASTDFLVPEHLDLELGFDTVMKAGSRLGTGTMIVLDDHTCPVGMVHNLEEFFARESCGFCTPCREGLPWVAKILRSIEEGEGRPDDLDVLAHHCRFLAPGHTFCAFAPGAAEPLQSALKYFREDFERHIRDRTCPWRAS